MSQQASCRRQWLQQQADEIVAQAAAQDGAEDAASEGETPWQRRGRQDREERLRRALAEVIAEEAERGWTRHRRQPGSGHSSRPPGLAATMWDHPGRS
jgi:hypothetical protein